MSLFQSLEPELWQGAQSIAERLRSAGHTALYAGGMVRDLLLGRDVSDIDLAVSAPPEEIERLFERTLPVGKQFGVVIVMSGSRPYEVATFRKESDYLDGRHPTQVSFSDPRNDALRRDFTVNGLFLDPFSEEVVDHVGGREDLEAGLLRTIGDPRRRFEEDKLRMLRAIRLACALDFQIEDRTQAQIRRQADQILQVSWERIRDEILKILTGPAPHKGLRMLQDLGLLRILLPEVAAMDGVEQPPQFHPEGDVLTHTCLMLELAGPLDATLSLGVLLHDVGKPPTFTIRDRIRFDGHAEVGARMADDICRRLKLANDDREEVVDLVRDHLRFIHVSEMRPSTLKRFLRKPNFAKHLELHRLDCLGSHRDLSSYEFCRAKLRQLRDEPVPPPPLINGNDLIRLGYQPGPLFKTILGAVEDLQLEGDLTTREEALEWVRREFVGGIHEGHEEL